MRNALSKSIQMREMLRHQMEIMTQKHNDSINFVTNLQRLLVPLENSLDMDLEELHDYMSRQDHRKLARLNEIAQEIIAKTQNPTDCTIARKLHCIVLAKCGLGCLLHQYGLCLFVAIGTNRVLQWNLNESGYYPGLDKAILHPSSTCVNRSGYEHAFYSDQIHSTVGNDPTLDPEIVKITQKIIRNRHQSFAPMSVPRKLLPMVRRVHSNPMLWWTGQVVSYLLRLQPWLARKIIKVKKLIKYVHPIACMHVRRTDKMLETPMRLKRYMDHVSNWYERYAMKNPSEKVVKRIFVATEEPSIHVEVKQKYPEYTFISVSPKKRKEFIYAKDLENSTESILIDVFLLKDCDFFVGTLSSNIGLLVTELRQTSSHDTTFSMRVLDDSYYYWGMIPRRQLVISNHTAPRQDGCIRSSRQSATCEIDIVVGDSVTVLRRMNKGYMLGGYNHRSKQYGLYPAHKVVDVMQPADYPAF
uniref:GT23 domain-containing protein n=1 Tax=Ciona savignyi TaxID=51511 RepID=H2ZA34_CIOSA